MASGGRPLRPALYERRRDDRLPLRRRSGGPPAPFPGDRRDLGDPRDPCGRGHPEREPLRASEPEHGSARGGDRARRGAERPQVLLRLDRFPRAPDALDRDPRVRGSAPRERGLTQHRDAASVLGRDRRPEPEAPATHRFRSRAVSARVGPVPHEPRAVQPGRPDRRGRRGSAPYGRSEKDHDPDRVGGARDRGRGGPRADEARPQQPGKQCDQVHPRGRDGHLTDEKRGARGAHPGGGHGDRDPERGNREDLRQVLSDRQLPVARVSGRGLGPHRLEEHHRMARWGNPGGERDGCGIALHRAHAGHPRGRERNHPRHLDSLPLGLGSLDPAHGGDDR